MEFGLVVVWLVTYLALLAAGQAIARTVLGDLADEGAGIGIPIATGIVWLVAYYVGHVSITAGLYLGIAAVVVGALAAHTLVGPIDRRIFAETAAVFSAAFLFMVAIRALDPAVHAGGGEKFLDFGLLRSLLRSSQIPPQDMWFAGETVRYYYGGHYLASLLTRLTGTAPRYAYNLALAGFYAMLATAVFGLGRNVAAGRDIRSRLAGGLSVFFVALASNLMPIGQLIVLVLPTSAASSLSSFLGFKIKGLATSLDAFSYWTASRVIEGTINEFPLFAWLNGDMHAHMMGTPFLLLGATLLFGYYRMPAEKVWRRRTLLFAGVPAVGAIVSVTNTWSVPTVCGLTLLTVAFAPSDPTTLFPERVRPSTRTWIGREISRLVVAIATAAVVGLTIVVLVLPYWLVVSSGSEGIGLLPDRSPLAGLLLVHGAFLTVAVLYYFRYVDVPIADLVERAGWSDALPDWLAEPPGAGAEPHSRDRGDVIAWLDPRPFTTEEIVALAGGVLLGSAVAASILLDVTAVGLFVPLILAGVMLHRADWHSLSRPGFESVLFVASAGLIVLVEFVYIKENAGGGRYNTVFKLYMEVWVLFGTAAGVALVTLLDDHRPSIPLSGPTWRRGFEFLAVVLVVSTSIYGVLALSEHHDIHGPVEGPDDLTLNALAFVEEDHPDEARAIEWLDENLEGQPTLLTRPGRQVYQWKNAPSSLTGIPTVAGWVHEGGYRGPETYYERARDVDTMFTGSPDRQRALLQRYDVEYVYIGPVERTTYGEITIDELDAVQPIERFGRVTIYRVNHDALG
ncbi:MAG: DUF2298 domain-containing protein [Halococcoides sp.]